MDVIALYTTPLVRLSRPLKSAADPARRLAAHSFSVLNTKAQVFLMVLYSSTTVLVVLVDGCQQVSCREAPCSLAGCSRPSLLCSQYVLMTDNQEKLPNTLHCPTGLSSDQCAPGFFDAAAPASQIVNGTQEPPQAHACCPGYFCPPMLTCMMPCPLGGFCPR